ncbi:hypothetical protein BDM02DRAFT_3192944 [Thelephora ganbajun]|uniref:Uncharacterized protein n=1 Tax=Thelephora ganbajun TaxID=370292 RepID=A0ACB6YZD6_THEGA|nr:hypothetical protein BDM02DRAFT_3192944 [Thelephora ganbajun]
MKGLIHEDDWLKEVVNEHDLNSWDLRTEQCCTAQQFKLHLTDHFLSTHAQIYPDVWAVCRMVLKKTQAYIKSLIRTFCQNRHGDNLKLATRRAKNRWERKTNLYHHHRDITFEYLQMAPQWRMLEALGVDGMSSDEEEKCQDYRVFGK